MTTLEGKKEKKRVKSKEERENQESRNIDRCAQLRWKMGQIMGTNKNSHYLGIRSTRKKFNLYSKVFE